VPDGVEPRWWHRGGKTHQQSERVEIEREGLLTTHHSASEAVEYVRRTRRAAVLHVRCVRLLGHAGSDVDTVYRAPSELEQALARDPLLGAAGELSSCAPESEDGACIQRPSFHAGLQGILFAPRLHWRRDFGPSQGVRSGTPVSLSLERIARRRNPLGSRCEPAARLYGHLAFDARISSALPGFVSRSAAAGSAGHGLPDTRRRVDASWPRGCTDIWLFDAMCASNGVVLLEALTTPRIPNPPCR
jgi:hypothetical protein